MASLIVFKISKLKKQSFDRPDDMKFYNSALVVILLYTAVYLPIPLLFEFLGTRFPQIAYYAPAIFCQLNVRGLFFFLFFLNKSITTHNGPPRFCFWI